jgi:hypothetical protein
MKKAIKKYKFKGIKVLLKESLEMIVKFIISNGISFGYVSYIVMTRADLISRGVN